MNKKTIFITIEIKSREFIPKVLLAYQLVQKGFRVYIGTFNTIDRAVDKVSSSVFFHKSTHIYKSEYYKSLGSVFVFLDEEGGITIPRSKLNDFCTKRYGVVNKAKNDLVLLPGLEYEKIVAKLDHIKDVELSITGWPRIDLWREEFLEIYQNEKESILKKHGNFYLLITSFGMTSERTFNDRINSSTTEFEVSYRTHKYKSFLKYVELIKELSKIMKEDEKIIIRPHPSEDISDWNSIINGLDNIRIVRDGDISPWILACDALIQYGSTTAVQAALNGIPSIQYKIKNEIGITDTPVFELSYDANTPEEVYHLLQKYKNKQDDNIKNKAEKILIDNMAYDKNQLASQKISNVLDEIKIQKVKKVKVNILDKIHPWYLFLINNYILLKRKITKKSTLKRIQIEKVPGGIKKHEAEEFLEKFTKIDKKQYNLKVKQVCKDLICIEGAN